MIICIESFNQKSLETVLIEIQRQLLTRKINNRTVQFPSQGPFGHQIRVVEDGRVQLHDIPYHLLRMVDRMDLFLNPTNGLALSDVMKNVILLTESQFKESVMTQDPEIQKWVIEINSNIPPVDHLFWLVEEHDKIHSSPLFPKTTQLHITQQSLKSAASQIVDFIINEVGHD